MRSWCLATYGGLSGVLVSSGWSWRGATAGRQLAHILHFSGAHSSFPFCLNRPAGYLHKQRRHFDPEGRDLPKRTISLEIEQRNRSLWPRLPLARRAANLTLVIDGASSHQLGGLAKCAIHLLWDGSDSHSSGAARVEAWRSTTAGRSWLLIGSLVLSASCGPDEPALLIHPKTQHAFRHKWWQTAELVVRNTNTQISALKTSNQDRREGHW